MSIVIPCFNADDTLGAAIQSGLIQGDVEIVVVDDGSTDRSLAVAQSFEPAIRVLTGPNRGVSAARNRGIRESSGEWIIFLDADDLLAPGTVETRLASAAQRHTDVIVCDWREFSGDNSNAPSGLVKSIDFKALNADAEIACATEVWATTCALMYRRALVEKIGGFRSDLPVIQDARFLFDAAYNSASFLHVPHAGAYYRVLPNSLSRRDPAKFWRDVLENGKQIESLWEARHPLSYAQRGALRLIYNSAARSLFLTGDSAFFLAIGALRMARLRISWRNWFAELFSRVVGQSLAMKIATRLIRARN